MLELLAARRRPVHEVWLDAAAKPSPILDRIAQLAAERGVPLRRVGRERLSGQARTDAPQGVLARAAPLPDAELDDLLQGRSRSGGSPFLLALDGVTDPHNLGALMRTADAAGVSGVVLPRHRSARITPAAAKAAAGAIEWVPVATVAGIPAALSEVSRAGLVAVGLDPTSDQSLFDLPLHGEPVVVVLGGEEKGLSPLVKRRCDTVVRIPSQGALASLNVSVAGALALFEVSRRRS